MGPGNVTITDYRREDSEEVEHNTDSHNKLKVKQPALFLGTIIA